MDDVDLYFKMVKILKACKEAGYKELLLGFQNDYKTRSEGWSRIFAGYVYVRPKIRIYKGKAGAPITHIIKEAFSDSAARNFGSFLNKLPKGTYDLTKPIEEIVRIK